MKAYIVETVYGSLALGEDGGLVAYELAPEDFDELVHQAMLIEDGEPTRHLLKLLDQLSDKGFKTLVIEDESLSSKLKSRGFTVEYQPGSPIHVAARAKLADLAVELGFAKEKKEFYEKLHQITMEYVRRRLKSHAQKRDLLAAQAIRATDDIDKTINLFIARLREWYSVHFPEMDELVPDHEDYVNIVAELGSRDNITVDNLVQLGFNPGKASKIAEAARKSIGADLSAFDIEAVQTLARITKDLYQLRRSLADYIANVMREVAPNITALVGPLLGARLISLAGGLDRLARMPASTIQVLGAEKALFRALRTGGRPPKHGVIFQYPDIHKSPRWQRGKIARALAAKLAIAAKVDAFTGRFIGDKLNEELRKRIEEIKTIYAKPPVRKKEVEKPKPKERPGRKPPRKGKGRKPRRGRRGSRRR